MVSYRYAAWCGRCYLLDNIMLICRGMCCLRKRSDTVGELKSAAMFVSYMPPLKAKKLGELTPSEVLLEL